MSNPILIKSGKAEGAIAAHRIVKFGAADGGVLQASAATDAMFGVSAELSALTGERCDVIKLGDADVEYGGAVTRGDELTADADGKAITATRHTHTENTAAAYAQNAATGTATLPRIIGVANVSGVLGDIGSVAIAPAFA
ncbi:MAG: capsid cement protein [Gallionellaceae bacterium]|jgi:hypothetical protein